VDEGISGWKEEREGFQSLMSDLDRDTTSAPSSAGTPTGSAASPFWKPITTGICWTRPEFIWPPLFRDAKTGRTSVLGSRPVSSNTATRNIGSSCLPMFAGKRAVAERGDWQGRRPFGYVVNEHRRLELGNPLEVQLVQRMFREYLEGRSLRSIALRSTMKDSPA
jgi:hypothetical protein